MPELHTLQFVWPQLLWLLWLLWLLGLLALGLRALARRPSGLQGLGMAAAAGPPSRRSARLHRLLWWGLSGTGLVLLVLALARPQALLLLPTRLDTLLLVIDSSGSMRADDVTPSRLEVARAAAQRLVERQPAAVRIGIVSVAAAAVLVQPPSTDRDAVLRAL